MEKTNAIIELLKNLDDNQLIALHNELCSNTLSEEYIYINDEDTFNEELELMTPLQIFHSTRNYKEEDDYFINGIYGIESFSSKDLYEHIKFDKLVGFNITEDYIGQADFAYIFSRQYAEEFGVEEYEDVEEWAFEENLWEEDWDELATTYNEQVECECVCPICGSHNVSLISKVKTTNVYNIYRCEDCYNEFAN